MYKESFKAHHAHELSVVSLSHFLMILGGCSVLGVPGTALPRAPNKPSAAPRCKAPHRG